MVGALSGKFSLTSASSLEDIPNTITNKCSVRAYSKCITIRIPVTPVCMYVYQPHPCNVIPIHNSIPATPHTYPAHPYVHYPPHLHTYAVHKYTCHTNRFYMYTCNALGLVIMCRKGRRKGCLSLEESTATVCTIMAPRVRHSAGKSGRRVS